MSLTKKIIFLIKNPLFPAKFYKLKNELNKLKNQGKQLWIFQCDFEGHYPYLEPYFEYGKQYTDVEIFFTVGYTRQKSPRAYLISRGVPADRILEPIDYIPRTKWDVYVSPTEWGNAFPQNDDCFRVQIFHTLADKNLEYSEELLKFNVIFANGPIHHKFLEKYIFNPHPESKKKIKVMNTGYAKIDNLFDNSIDKNEVKKSLNIDVDDSRKIILYAPNWEAGSALRTYGEEVFEELKNSEHLVIIKLHYMSLLSPDYEYATGGKDWQKVLKKYESYENIRIVNDQNINPYLYIADLMLTDYGGASLEFMAMDKPIVYLHCPGFFEERGYHVFEYEALKSGPVLKDMRQINPTINDLLKGDDSFRDKRHEISDQLLYNPGKAAQKGFEVLYNLVRKKQKTKGTINGK